MKVQISILTLIISVISIKSKAKRTILSSRYASSELGLVDSNSQVSPDQEAFDSEAHGYEIPDSYYKKENNNPITVTEVDPSTLQSTAYQYRFKEQTPQVPNYYGSKPPVEIPFTPSKEDQFKFDEDKKAVELNKKFERRETDMDSSKVEKHIFETMRIKNVRTPVLQTIGKSEIKLRQGAKIVIGHESIPVNDLLKMYKYYKTLDHDQ